MKTWPATEAISDTHKALEALRSYILFLLFQPPSPCPCPHLTPPAPLLSPYTNIQEQGSVETKWWLKHYLLHVFKLKG